MLKSAIWVSAISAIAVGFGSMVGTRMPPTPMAETAASVIPDGRTAAPVAAADVETRLPLYQASLVALPAAAGLMLSDNFPGLGQNSVTREPPIVLAMGLGSIPRAGAPRARARAIGHGARAARRGRIAPSGLGTPPRAVGPVGLGAARPQLSAPHYGGSPLASTPPVSKPHVIRVDPRRHDRRFGKAYLLPRGSADPVLVYENGESEPAGATEAGKQDMLKRPASTRREPGRYRAIGLPARSANAKLPRVRFLLD